MKNDNMKNQDTIMAIVQNKAAFREVSKAFTHEIMERKATGLFAQYGTVGGLAYISKIGALPTRNFSAGSFEGSSKIGGKAVAEINATRGGSFGHVCMAGCVVQCSNTYAGEDGKAIVAPLEYETIGLMGSNLGIASLDEVARLNWEASDLGLDSIEIGAALGVAAEAGLLKFGDGARALELMREVRQATPLGRILGHGAAMTGRVFGVQRVPVVKGQAMAAYEPRGIKGTGTTYVTSPQGADHTAGNTVRAKVDHLDGKANIAVSRGAQINAAGFDTLGACLFAGFGLLVAPEVISELLNARYGWQVGADILQILGRETLAIEREFNKRAGFTAADDRIPEYMRTEPLPPHNSVYDADEADLDNMFNW